MLRVDLEKNFKTTLEQRRYGDYTSPKIFKVTVSPFKLVGKIDFLIRATSRKKIHKYIGETYKMILDQIGGYTTATTEVASGLNKDSLINYNN